MAIRIVVFFVLPAWGLSNAAATLVGQNLGARRPDRAEQAVWRTGLYNMIFLGSIGIFFVIFATPVVKLFVDDPAVIPIAAVALRTFACGNIGYAYGMVMLQAFNGAGDTFTPTLVNFFGFWVLELPLAWVLAVGLHMHAEGAFLSIVIAECSMAVAGIVLFRQRTLEETADIAADPSPCPIHRGSPTTRNKTWVPQVSILRPGIPPKPMNRRPFRPARVGIREKEWDIDHISTAL